MKITELYTKECKVWIPDDKNVWRAASLVNDYNLKDKEITVLLEALEEEDEVETKKILSVANPESLPPLRNPEILVGENDLTSLSYLHEPAVLHNLQIRFVERNAIYTYCGIVLVAINPYDELSIYSNEFIELYSGRNLGEMDPHIFAIAEEAFKQMSREERNQSIIVTGESGAGKTVSAKYTMRYFASVGGSSDESNVEQKVLASNPIMESIGNAKTTRNDNSSRFGKYIQIGFNKRYHIIGANMRTYLLEKSRVVSQGPDERNYHIFYQLCACCDLPQFQPLKLMPASHFEYTRVGNCIEIDGVDDKKEFQETVHALTLLGVSSKHQSLIFRLLSAILHMGNIDIEEGSRGNDSCRIDVEDKHLQAMCELLGIEAKQMAQWFCNKKLTTMAEVVVTPLKYEDALFARDALAKHMYSKLFEWIVKKVNAALISNEKQHSFIGVLDIYGFETFEINSFEQFCINYANEKLQQQFCQHVFKLEQEEYVREEIEWKFIDFYDNQPCIDLIESKLGILDLLNDECRLPKGSDQSWAQKLYNRHLKTSKHFEKSKLSNTSFFVIHFADKVRYECEGFLEKNRDTVREEQLSILKASQFELISELFMDHNELEKVEVKVGMKKGGAARITSSRQVQGFGNRKKDTKKTVANQFQESLGQLMTTLNATTPHYVRCVKPNDYKMSFTFDVKRAVQQLRACGVLETIRISAAGYPSRWSYPEFHGRYRVLMKSQEISKKSHRETCETVLARLIPEPDKYQPGKTKIFFRAGQVAYLEKLRADKLKACAVLIQKQVRMWLKKKAYMRMKQAALCIQRFVRGHQARRLVTSMRRTRASISIQTCWRRYVETKKYTKIRNSIITIQAYTRGLFARKLYMELVYEAKAIIIQKYIRSYLARRHFRQQLKAIVYLQCCVRRMRARKELKALKIEARSVDHFKKLNIGMENKIMELQRKLDHSNYEKSTFEKKANEVEILREKIFVFEQSQGMLEQLKTRIIELENEVLEVKAVLSDSQAESKIVLESLEKENKNKDEIILNLTTQRDGLNEKYQNLETEMKTREEEIKLQNEKEIESKCSLLESELTEERQQHQTVLKDYNRLEQRYDNIKDELELIRSKDDEQKGDTPPESAYYSMRSNQLNLTEMEMQMNGDAPETNGIKNEEFILFKEKINDLENEKLKLQERICAQKQTTVEFAGQLKMKETASYNEQLKNEIDNLRKAIKADAGKFGKDGKVFEELYEQMQVMQEELEIRRDEVIQLKSYVAGQSLSSIDQCTMTSPDLLGSKNRMEDITLEKLDKSDLKAVLVTVYDHNRMLELEIESERNNHDTEMANLQASFKQNKMKKNGSFNLASGLNENSDQETRLKSELLKLQASNESYEKLNHRLKRQLKLYSRKLNSEFQSNMLGAPDTTSSLSRNNSTLSRASNNEDDSASLLGHPILRHKDSTTGALGMFQYKSGDEAKIVQSIVLDFKPRGVAVNMIPGLPAFILFKLLKYADHNNDDKMIKQLLQHIIRAIKKVEKKYTNDCEYLSFWLSNTCRLCHNMKQFSGEPEYIKDNTDIQKEHCFRNFDLGEYRPVFSDIAISLFQRLVLNVVKKIKPMIVPAMLEHDTIQGLSSSSKPSGMRGRTSSRDSDESAETVETLMKQLTAYHQMMIQHGIEESVIKQVFRQVIYGITATTLNNQLVRKEMCNWSKAMQIRYNVSQLEEWLRKSGFGDDLLKDMLQPLVHTSQLLQVKKQTDTDADEIINMCTSLNDQQIVKLLQMITPTNDYEERVSVKFIKIVQKKLKGEKHTPDIQGDSLLMDTNRNFAVTFPYSPTQQSLDTISVPENLKASSLIKAL